MNTTQLSLTFDDVMLASTFISTDVTLEGLNGAEYPLQGGTVLTPDGFVMAILLIPSDVDQLRLNPDIATSLDDTFVSTTTGFVRDYANLGVVSVNRFQATTFIQDQIAPTLLNYTLDINNATLTLYTDEIIDPATFTPSGFTLQSMSNDTSGQSYTLTGGEAALVSPPQTYMVIVTLSDNDLNGLKMTVGVAEDLTNTFLSLAEGAIADTAGNSIVPVPPSQARQAASLDADMIPPLLNSISLDLVDGALVFDFTEPVNSTGFLSLVELHNGDGLDINLSTATVVAPEGSSLVQIVPSDLILNFIKLNTSIGTSINDTYVNFQGNEVTDFVGLQLVSTPSSRPVDEVIADTLGPVIESSSFDLNSGLLKLTFNEYSQADTLNLSSIYIKNADSELVLANLADATTNSTSGREFFIFVSTDDLNALNSDSNLESISLTISGNLIEDILGNPFNSTEDILIDVLISDNLPPQLQSFSIDLNIGNLLLTFSESIVADLFNISYINLHGTPENINGYRLQEGNFSITDQTIEVFVSENDLNAIKALASVGVEESTSFLTLSHGIVSDIRGNTITEDQTVGASSIIRDAVSPSLNSFAFEFTNSGKAPAALVLEFSETVDVSSFQYDQIVLHQFSNGSGEMVTLSSSPLPISNSRRVSILLINDDLELFNRAAPVAVDLTSTFLTLSNSSLTDTSGNQVNPITLPVTGPLIDLQPPALLNFTLDMIDGELTLTFSEAINVSTLDLTNLVLQDDEINPMNSYIFQYDGTVASSTITTISVNVDSRDINGIKGVLEVATSLDKTFAAPFEGLVQDEDGHNSFAILSTAALQADDLVIESDPPKLLFFNVNFNPGQPISLQFSETVLDTSVQLDQIVLQNSATNPTVRFNFSMANPITESSDTLDIYLPFEVRDQILANSSIATSISNTYISIATGAVSDRDGNPIEATVQQVQSLATDTTPPSVIRVVLDLNSGLFEVGFDESVIGSTITLDNFTLQNSAENASTTYMLQSDYIIPSEDVSFFRLFLTDVDLNAIKIIDLCDSMLDCYLGFAQGSFNDTRRLGTDGGSVQVTDYRADTVRPEFVEFTQIDLTNREIIISFSEPVNATSFIPSGFTLKSLFSVESISNFTLTGGIPTSQGDQLAISLSESDALAIITDPNLCTWRGNCYIAISEGSISDPADLSISAVTDMPNTIVQTFVVDAIEPELISFILDMNRRELLLTFSEPVDPESLTYQGITLQDALVPTEMYTLTDGSTSSTKGQEIIVQLTREDANQLKNTTFATRMTMATYISLSSNTITDLALEPNNVQTVNGMRGNLTRDITSPRLTSYNLNLDTDMLMLTFDEVIDLESLDLTEFTLTVAGVTRQLRRGTLTSSSLTFTHAVHFRLNASDIQTLKHSMSAFATTTNTALSVTPQALDDTSGNPLREVVSLRPISVTTDTTPIELTGFSLDMSDGILYLTFSDIIDPSTFNPNAVVLQSAVTR